MTEQLNNEVVDQELDSFWSAVDEAVAIGRGGSGTIGQVEIGFCWKVFSFNVNVPQHEAIWKYDVTDKKSIQAAKDAANHFIIDKGLDLETDPKRKARPQMTFFIRMIKDSVLNKDTDQWEGDKWYFNEMWTGAYSDTIAPKLKELGVKDVGVMWAKVSWMPDPNRAPRMVNKLDQDGNPVLDEEGNPVMEPQARLFSYISAIYANKEEAMEAAGVSVGSDTSPAKTELNYPKGYDKSSWEIVIAEIKKAKEGGAALPQIASDYGLEMSWVTKALNS
jgi:hypothetical protein